MYTATFVGFFALALSALQASALQVVKRQSTRTGILLPRQSSASCVTICTSADNAITACGDPTCLCTISIANNLQQCVNCLLEGSPDATTLTDVDGIVTDFDSLCSGFPVPAVTTAGSISTPAGTQTTKSTTTPSQSPTPKSNTNSASTPITSPGGAGTTLPANGGSATAPASSMYYGGLLASLTLALSVWQVSAFQAIERSLLRNLSPRQDSTACDSICTSIESTLSSCNTTACLCTKVNANNLQQCINCVLETSNAAPGVVSSTEQVVSAFKAVCSKSSIPVVTISNTTGSGPTPTPSASSSVSPSAVSAPTSNSATKTVTSITHLPPPTNSLTMPVTIPPSDISGPSNTDVSPSTSTSPPAGSGGSSNGACRRGAGTLLVLSTVISVPCIISLF
ncbi:hypothetical protein CVT26_007729 [Gymnopilus dilepis]|uniref:Extracellular membrane protein CFEM domain-containing protein n=1 Tax=Gymnopilus dilepis TaxID=231916 RepID=A0A409VZY1_9AGAR|nr:hypothetical protein CVT26_007729 [Gymnopilus dilepis]